jgi:hypothetical protein
MKEHMSK